MIAILARRNLGRDNHSPSNPSSRNRSRSLGSREEVAVAAQRQGDNKPEKGPSNKELDQATKRTAPSKEKGSNKPGTKNDLPPGGIRQPGR